MNKLLTNLSNYSVVLILLAIAYFVGLFTTQDKSTQYKRDFNTYVDTAVTPLMKKNDSLAKIVKIKSTQIDSIHTKSVILTNEISGLKNTTVVLRKQNIELVNKLSGLPDTCKPALIVINNLTQEIDTLNKTIQTLEKRDTLRLAEIELQKNIADIERSRAKAAVDIIKNWPKPKPNRILGFIPAPSHNTTLVIGILGGAFIRDKMMK